jgi:PAS domain-containing protein/DNA-binding CsgD family transcriptional regulator
MSPANSGPNLFRHIRAVSWQMPMLRSNRRSPTLPRDGPTRTYISTARRITSGEQLTFPIARAPIPKKAKDRENGVGSLGALLPDLYATAQDSTRWVAVLDGLCEVLGTRNAATQVLHREGDRLRAIDTARDSYSLAHALLHDRHVNNEANPRLDLRCSAWVPKCIVRDSDRFEPGSAAYAALRSRLAAVGLGASIGLTFELGQDSYFSLIMHRDVDDERDFDERAEATLNELLPHLRQTMAITASLDEARDTTRSLQDAINLVRLGVVVCNADGRVRWLNRSAETTISRSPLLRLCDRHLCATTRAGARTLQDVLTAAPSTDGLPVATIEHQGDLIQIRAALIGENRADGLRALFLSDAAAPLDISPDDVARLFSLSPAEARLATAIAGGASVSSYSALRGIAVGTARVQLKQVLAKTQASKQVDLMRQLCGSVVAQTVYKQH